jgi:hypothetical protein
MSRLVFTAHQGTHCVYMEHEQWGSRFTKHHTFYDITPFFLFSIWHFHFLLLPTPISLRLFSFLPCSILHLNLYPQE